MSTPQEMQHCPNDETLAAFIDGRLQGAERDAVIEHVATCGECRSICQGAWELQVGEAAAGDNVLRPHFRQWWLYAAAAAMLMVVGTLVVGPKVQERRQADEVVAEVNKTLQRSIDGRLFGEHVYRVHITNRGSGVDPDAPPPVDRALNQLDLLAADAADYAEKHRTARNLHTFGVAKLGAAQKVEDLDAAIDALDEAAAKSPDDLALLNDRAAAYAARGSYNRPADVEKAIELAERAWKIKHTAETGWNRAIALDLRAKGSAAAIAAWNDYLRLDSSSDWAEKAKEKRDGLGPF